MQAGSETTRFSYDPLDQLKEVTDPLNQVTSYDYDNLGRMVEENHPDRGVTLNTYDEAGNLIKVVTPETGAAGIQMNYHFTRVDTITVPNSPAVNDVEYTYGSLGDGKNGAGRIIKVVQGTDYKTERYRYDMLGNAIFEKKEIQVPQAGLREFTTRHEYDSWGRVQMITYPDGEEVSYQYAPAGELENITADKNSYTNPRTVISAIYYDGLGNILNLIYGNGAATGFTYNSKTQRLTGLELNSNSNTLLDKDIYYTMRANVDSISNSAPPVNGMGGTYGMGYDYDNLNRLTDAEATFNSTEHDIDLALGYNEAGGIVSKQRTNSGSQAANAPAYNYSYTYESGKKHRIKQIDNVGWLHPQQYDFNDAGSITDIYALDPITCPPGEPCTGGYDTIYKMEYHWDEEQKLSGAKKDPGLHHYLYDHNGERIMKSSLRRAGAALDGEGSPNSYVADPYTVYVNPYYVATAYSESVEASKHYYMGSQRVASALMSKPFVPYDDNPSEEPEDPDPEPESSGSGLIGAAVNLQSLLDHFEMEEGVDYDMTALLEMESVEPGTGYSSVSDFLNSTDCDEDEQCLCEKSLYWAQEAGYNCEESQVMYWYHPDYLGNTEFITDLAGDPFQYFWYTAFGESIEEQHSGDGFYSSAFRFNAKELDQETGNYYYGARYYNPQTSIWLSVDPLAEKFPSWTPYNYTLNNPINLIDPDGRAPGDPPKTGGGGMHMMERGNKGLPIGDGGTRYGGRGNNGITITPGTHNGKFTATTTTFIDVAGQGVSKIDISSDVTETTGFWDYNTSTGTSVSTGAGAGIDVELMSATKGDVTFNSNIDATSLSDAFNQGSLVNSGNASALLKYTKLEGFDGAQSMNSVWEANTFGGGVATAGVSGSRSMNTFDSSPMTTEDSIKRAVFDQTIPGRSKFLQNKGINNDSVKKLQETPWW